VLLGDKVRVVTEVTRLEKGDIPDSTFHLPADYILKGAQMSRPAGASASLRISARRHSTAPAA
ncbi:MAG: hypothetical protein ACREQY_12680, partial [Candidatus Binatia bacterium]